MYAVENQDSAYSWKEGGGLEAGAKGSPLCFSYVLFSDLGADFMDTEFVKTSASCVFMCTFPCGL